MNIFCDLHIHSCLSPCGDMLMTPNNIVGMAFIKQLDAIAVCDHNTAENLPAVKEVADMMGVVLLPGMELTTREEAHMLAYSRMWTAPLPSAARCAGIFRRSKTARNSSAVRSS